MKQFNTLLTVAVLTLAPVLANAQWSAVRFDSANIFRNIYAPTPNDVFSAGTNPTNGEYFLVRSDDGGTTWDSITLNSPGNYHEVYEMHFPDANNGFIGGRKNNATQSMIKTVDNGTTWTDITPDPVSIETISGIYFLDANQGWATSGQNLYITGNGGSNWSTVTLSFTPEDIYFQDALVGYAAGGSTMSVPALMMKTIDGGQTWTQILQSSDPNWFVNKFNFINVVDQNTMFTAMDYTNKLFRTTDAGATWDTIICDSAQQILDFHFESADSGHVLTAMGQLYYTNDGGASWNLAYTAEWGLYGPTVLFYSLNFSQGVGYVCGSSGLIKRFDLNLTGIHIHETLSVQFGIFPNPCYFENAEIVFTGVTLKGKLNMKLINMEGQTVLEQEMPAAVDGQVRDFFFPFLPAGTYSVVLTNGTESQNSKLILQ